MDYDISFSINHTQSSSEIFNLEYFKETWKHQKMLNINKCQFYIRQKLKNPLIIIKIEPFLIITNCLPVPLFANISSNSFQNADKNYNCRIEGQASYFVNSCESLDNLSFGIDIDGKIKSNLSPLSPFIPTIDDNIKHKYINECHDFSMHLYNSITKLKAASVNLFIPSTKWLTRQIFVYTKCCILNESLEKLEIFNGEIDIELQNYFANEIIPSDESYLFLIDDIKTMRIKSKRSASFISDEIRVDKLRQIPVTIYYNNGKNLSNFGIYITSTICGKLSCYLLLNH